MLVVLFGVFWQIEVNGEIIGYASYRVPEGMKDLCTFATVHAARNYASRRMEADIP